MTSNGGAAAAQSSWNFFVSLCLCGEMNKSCRLAHPIFMNHRVTETQRESIAAHINRSSGVVIDAAYAVHSQLGPGLLEFVYETCLAHAIRRRGLFVQRQVMLPIEFEGLRLPSGLRIDMLVNYCVIVEIKAVEALLPVHRAQLLTYLKLSGHRVGLLINFNVPLIKDGIRRIAL
jgi:GxxExxY protein